jgi:hypothetical protein
LLPALYFMAMMTLCYFSHEPHARNRHRNAH